MAAASALTDLTSSSRNQNADGSDTSTDGDDHLTTIPKEISTDSSPSKKILDKRILRFPVKVSTHVLKYIAMTFPLRL